MFYQFSIQKIRTLLSAAFLITASACSTIPADHLQQPLAQIDNISQGGLSSSPAVLLLHGKPAILYATPENRVAFRYGDKTILLDGDLQTKGGQFFQLHRFGNTLFALWWSHLDGKNLYCAVSHDDGKTFAHAAIVNTENGVLPPYSLVYAPDDSVIGLVHMDERHPRFEVYFTRTTDQGVSWLKPDVRLDTPPNAPELSNAVFPKIVQAGKTWIVIWTDTKKVDGRVVGRLLARVSPDFGKTWEHEHIIYQSDSLLTGMTVRSDGATVLTLVQDSLKGMVGFITTDNGETWKTIGGAPQTSNTNNSSINVAFHGDHAYVVWSAQPGINVQGKAGKGQINVIGLNLRTGLWQGDPVRIDIDKPINQTLSLEPHIAVTKKGIPVVTWTDFRNIRPNIYLSASFDQGKTWTRPQDIEIPGKFSAIFSKLYAEDDAVILSYEKFPTDSRKQRELIVRKLVPVAPNGFENLPSAEQISSNKKEERLKIRVNEFWKLRTEGHFVATYEFFDPAFKNAVSKVEFAKHQGNFIYNSAQLEKVHIDGNIAEVTEKVNYQVKPTQIAGQEIKIPPTDAEITSTWVWIFDDWYEVYQPPFGEPFIQY